MSLIRNGIFTEYKGYQLKLIESRIEVPIPVEQKEYQIWYDDDSDCPFEDFEKSNHNNGFFKTVKIDQLKNVFAIRTLGKYHNFIIEVFVSKNKNHFQIATRNQSIASELKFNKIGEDWYMKELESSELELVWEEVIQIKQSNEKFGHIARIYELLQIRMNQLKQESNRYE